MKKFPEGNIPDDEKHSNQNEFKTEESSETLMSESRADDNYGNFSSAVLQCVLNEYLTLSIF